MIRQLQIKMIAITMGILIAVFAVVFWTLNTFMRTNSARQTEHFLRVLAEQDGWSFLSIPPEQDGPPFSQNNARQLRDPNPHVPFAPDFERMRAGGFFYVKLDEQGQALETNFERMFDFSQEQALALAQQAVKGRGDHGTIDNLQYLIAEKEYGKIVVFAERSVEARMLAELIRISIWVAGAAFVVLFVFSFLLSKWAVRPVAAAFARQRRFISDASHELKTPLTIIGANVDVMENEIGANTRLTHIKEQANRMNLLVHDLLALAKADEYGASVIKNEFNLSKTLENTTLEFESAAFEAGKQLAFELEEGIHYLGNEQQMKQLLSILIDNAIKHSNPQGTIRVVLRKAGERPQLCVYNTGPGIAENEKEKIFDRFYRSDDSRSRETGGYGLGLSIAKAIVTAHKGKISVNGRPGQWIEFVVTL